MARSWTKLCECIELCCRRAERREWRRLAECCLRGPGTVILEASFLQNSVMPAFIEGAPAGTVTVAVPAPWTVTCAVVLNAWPAALMDMFSVDCDGLPEAITDAGGIMTPDDLKGYQALIRAPVRGAYRGYDIVSMPQPSSGGVVLVETLNILEGFPLSRMERDSAASLHLLIEAMKRGYADRAHYLGDPDFFSAPIATLISKEYAAKQRATKAITGARLTLSRQAWRYSARSGTGRVPPMPCCASPRSPPTRSRSWPR